MQTAEKPLIALSSSDEDIYKAALQRAHFWGYRNDENYTVSVRLPGKPVREVSVHHDGQTGTNTIQFPKKKG